MYNYVNLTGLPNSLVLAPSAADNGFESRSDQNEDYTIEFVSSPVSTQYH